MSSYASYYSGQGGAQAPQTSFLSEQQYQYPNPRQSNQPMGQPIDQGGLRAGMFAPVPEEPPQYQPEVRPQPQGPRLGYKPPRLSHGMGGGRNLQSAIDPSLFENAGFKRWMAMRKRRGPFDSRPVNMNEMYREWQSSINRQPMVPYSY